MFHSFSTPVQDQELLTPGHRDRSWKISLILMIPLLLSLACNTAAGLLQKAGDEPGEHSVEPIDPISEDVPSDPDPVASDDTDSLPPAQEQGPNIANPGVDAPMIWVYLTAEDELAFENSNQLVFVHPGSDGELVFVDSGFEAEDWVRLPEAGREIRIAGGSVNFRWNSPSGPALLRVFPDGSKESIPSPTSAGLLIDAVLSHDGTQIIWLFDVTQNAPDLFSEPVCDSTVGCVGWVYEIVLTDSQGAGAKGISSYESADPFPRLSIAGWDADGGAVSFYRVPWMLASAYWLPRGGGILSVDVPGGTLKEQSADYLGSESVISPDGGWVAWGNFGDGVDALKVQGPGGQEYRLPFIEDSRPLTAEMTFSPGSKQLAWIELDDRSEPAVFVVRRMQLDQGVPETVRILDDPVEDDFPYLGSWFGEEALVISSWRGSRILNLETGKWIIRERPFGGPVSILLGRIAP
jgi:hypothetical protein